MERKDTTMSDGRMEIYVRNNAGCNVPVVYADEESRSSSGRARDANEPSAFLELSVLPEWITEQAAREA